MKRGQLYVSNEGKGRPVIGFKGKGLLMGSQSDRIDTWTNDTIEDTILSGNGDGLHHSTYPESVAIVTHWYNKNINNTFEEAPNADTFNNSKLRSAIEDKSVAFAWPVV